MSHPHEPEDVVAYNERSLRALVRAITLSQGQFSLILVRCNYAALRERMVQRLRQLASVKIRELNLPKSVKTLYTTIQAELGSEQPPTLMVFGLESVSAIDQVLTSTNQVREEFRKNFPNPLVLWLNDEVLRKLIRLAPDFESWATTIEFAIATDELIDFLRQTTDQVFAQVLATGAGKFLDNAAINLAIDSRPRAELESAREHLHSLGVRLESELEASLEFVRGRDANDLEIARQHYERSLTFWQQSDDLERRACLLYYLGLWWRRHAVLPRAEDQKARERARDYFQQCVEVFRQAHRPDLEAKFINALGEVLQQLKQWEELETFAKAALDLHHTYADPIRLAYDYGLLAEVALAKFDWGEAKLYAEAALRTNAQASDSTDDLQHLDINLSWAQRQYRSLYWLLLAQAQQHLGQVQEAIQNLKAAKEECTHQYEPQLYIRILETLRALYYEQGHYLEAFEIKQEQRSIEQQYGVRAFIGAGRLHSERQVINPALLQGEPQATVALEIAASGRQQDVNRLLQRISRNDHKLTVIHGQSGVGKSSIIQAGLVPALKQRPIGERDALPVLLQVYTDWVGTLGRCLANALKEVRGQSLPAPIDSTAAIIEQLRKSAERNLLTVLIFDQFEELFFVDKEQAKRRPFYEFLHTCLEEIPYVKVILSLREDYLHFLLECNRLTALEVINNNILDKEILYYLGNFSLEDAKSVSESLTKRSQFYLEPELIDTLVKELARELGEVRPIELQVVGTQLQTDNITTLKTYYQLGPKPKAKLVERFLEEVIKDCGSPNEATARMSLYLLTDENGTRPQKTRAELALGLKAAELKSEAEKIDLVLKILEESGLLLLLKENPVHRYQLVHDYLVSFIRQQQETGLLAKLAVAKEKQKLTEKQLEQSLHQEKQERQRAEIAEIEALGSLSQALLLSHDQLGALIASVKAVRQLNKTEAPSDIKLRIMDGLRQAVYEVQECNRFEGHSSSVLGVSFSPDGKMLASASDDKTVKLWNLDGTEVRTFRDHSDWVWGVSFSPDGKMLASASDDKTVKLWSLDGTKAQTFQGHRNRVWGVSFSPDGQMLASASEDKTVKLWNLDGTEVRTFHGHSDRVWGVSFSPDGQMLASASEDKTVKLWNLDGTEVRTFQGHRGWVRGVSFSLDGKMLASASEDRTVKLWSLDGKEVQTFEGHSDWVLGVSFSADGRRLASASADNTVKLWSLDGTELRTFQGHRRWVRSVSFSPDGQRLASASEDKTVKLWSLDGTELLLFHRHSGWVLSVSFSPDGQMLASASADKTVKLWSIDGTEVRTFHGHSDRIKSVSFSPDGQMLASASDDNTVKLWSLDGTKPQTFEGHGNRVRSVSFSPDGKMLVSASEDKTVKLWSLDGTEVRTFQGHSDWVRGVSFSPDGKMLASASDDETVKLWNLDGTEVRTVQGHRGWVRGVSFSPDGKMLASASEDRTVKLWSLDGKEVQTFQGHSDWVLGVSFSPDGQMLASASADNTVKLWSLDGKELRTFKGHRGWVRSVSFSPDGKMLASASADNTVRLWSLNGIEYLDLDALLVRGCNWLHDYLNTNPNVSESDRHLCDGIVTQK